MAQTIDKKRKRESAVDEKPSKKLSSNGAPSGAEVNVSFRDSDAHLSPVLVSSPGITTPSIPFHAHFKSKSKKASTKSVPHPSSHDCYLHSTRHPRLDYTAATANPEEATAHYIAVFDPTAQHLQVFPAHQVALRSTLRSEVAEETEKPNRTYGQQRADLGQEFGTKKAKKAIADRTANAIARDTKDKKKTDGVQDAVLGAVADSAVTVGAQKDAEQTLLDSKPIPRPDTTAEKVEDVYRFNMLVPVADARLVNTLDWQEKARADEVMEFHHRFPASRAGPVGKGGNPLRLKALRYLHLLLEFHDVLQSAGKSGKKVPRKEVIQTKLSSWPEALVDSVRHRFANRSNELPKWHMDNLYTHMCALSLFVDGWVTDASNLRDDLKMDTKEIRQYFRELGCRVGPPTEKERLARDMSKKQANSVTIAKLKLPLDFPKPRIARRR